MPKVKPKRKSPVLDMTPMVDLAFLLVTFFMLTTQFRAEEPVQVEIPTSIQEAPIPDKNVMVITVSNDGKVFFYIDNQNDRTLLLDNISKAYNVEFTEEQKYTFSNLSSFGAPVAELPAVLAMSKSERKERQPGIPVDSLGTQPSELHTWIINARAVNQRLAVAIKADQDTPFEVVQKVFDILQAQEIDYFNLITGKEEDPRKQRNTGGH